MLGDITPYLITLLLLIGTTWFFFSNMNDRLRGFGGTDVFTLVVGPTKERLSVPKDILTQIPHFRIALSSGDFAESHSKRFELLEDSPKAIADIIYFTHSGRIPLPEDEDSMRSYIRTWIVADKYQAETLANGMIDKIVAYHQNTVVKGKEIVILREAGLEDSLLFDLLLRVIAWDMSHSVYKSDFTFKGMDFDVLSKMELELVLEIIMKQTKKDEDPLDAAKKAPCLLHTHALTPVCKPSE